MMLRTSWTTPPALSIVIAWISRPPASMNMTPGWPLISVRLIVPTRARQHAVISIAVGVVAPVRAGMASGINSNLRQVGIATGVATLGTILVSHVHSSVLTGLQGTPLAGHAHAIAHAVSTGGGADAITSTPPPLRGLVALTARSALVQGLNTIMLISAVVAFAAAVASFVLIRERDFVALDEDEEELELAVAA
jgi:hypothetical protein